MLTPTSRHYFNVLSICVFGVHRARIGQGLQRSPASSCQWSQSFTPAPSRCIWTKKLMPCEGKQKGKKRGNERGEKVRNCTQTKQNKTGGVNAHNKGRGGAHKTKHSDEHSKTKTREITHNSKNRI